MSFDIEIFRDNGATPGQLDGTDTLVDTVATTVGTGAWSKTGLKPDSYIVCEVQKANWTQSKPRSGGEPGLRRGRREYGERRRLCRDADFRSGSQNVDFGNYRDASLSGVKFEDKNADGTKDAGDTGPVTASFDIKIFRDNGATRVSSMARTHWSTPSRPRWGLALGRSPV